MRTSIWRAVIILAIAVSGMLVLSPPTPAADPDVAGTYATTSQVGGTAWTFQPSGRLFATGPDALELEGAWAIEARDGRLAGELDWTPTGQRLAIVAVPLPGADRMVMFVRASAARASTAEHAWPLFSILLAERMAMVAVWPSPAPTTSPPCRCHPGLPSSPPTG